MLPTCRVLSQELKDCVAVARNNAMMLFCVSAGIFKFYNRNSNPGKTSSPQSVIGIIPTSTA
jgi:hypothetical protein